MRRRNLHILILFDVLQRLFQRENHRRRQHCLVIRRLRTHVRQFLRFRNVYHDIAFLAVLAYHLPRVHFLARVDEEPSAVLQFVQRVGVCRAAFHRYQRTVVALHYLALVRLILIETVRHNRLARAHIHHIGAHTHDTARWY